MLPLAGQVGVVQADRRRVVGTRRQAQRPQPVRLDHRAVQALAGPYRTLSADDLEVGLLARSNGRRAFRRLTDTDLAELLGSAPSDDASAS